MCDLSHRRENRTKQNKTEHQNKTKQKPQCCIYKILGIAVNCDFQYSLQCVVALFLFHFYSLQVQLIKTEKFQLEKPPE